MAIKGTGARLKAAAVASMLVAGVCCWAAFGAGAAGAKDGDLLNQLALDWNAQAVSAVRAATTTDGVPAGGAPRSLYQVEGLIYMGYVQGAVYDAVTKIEHRYRPYGGFSAGAGNASPDAALVEAAYDTLTYYLGDPHGTLAAAYATSLAELPTGDSTERGLAVGAAAARDMEARRAGDGRDASTEAYGQGALAAGSWQIVPPQTTAQTPWVAFMKPFLLRNVSQFRVPAPPALDSPQYARDFEETKAYGSATSPVRTPEQTATAWFWNANAISQYNQLYRDVASQQGLDLVDTVRLLALGNMAVADAGIACFDSKYDYLRWRPYTAIRNAGIDDNAATTTDPGWLALLSTPNHPEYPAAHGCLTSAATDVVASVLGTNDVDVTVWGSLAGSSKLDVPRRFATVADIQKQVVDARVWGGLHWRFSVVAGETLGNEVAKWILARDFQPQGSGG